jgi:hypothetical protein
MLPRNALPSIVVCNAGLGSWWAVTAEVFNCHLISTLAVDSSSASQSSLFQQHKRHSLQKTRPVSVKCGKSLCNSQFPCQKGGPEPDLHPRPPDLHWNATIFCFPLMICWHQGGAFGIFFLAGISTQFHPGHKLSVQGWLDANQDSYVFKCTYLQWGKISQGNGWHKVWWVLKFGLECNGFSNLVQGGCWYPNVWHICRAGQNQQTSLQLCRPIWRIHAIQ